MGFRNREHLLDKLFYTRHNPIHHRFCKGYRDYPYSSYHDYREENGEWIYLPILKYFTLLENFIQAHEEYRINFPGFEEDP